MSPPAQRPSAVRVLLCCFVALRADAPRRWQTAMSIAQFISSVGFSSGVGVAGGTVPPLPPASLVRAAPACPAPQRTCSTGESPLHVRARDHCAQRGGCALDRGAPPRSRWPLRRPPAVCPERRRRRRRQWKGARRAAAASARNLRCAEQRCAFARREAAADTPRCSCVGGPARRADARAGASREEPCVGCEVTRAQARLHQ